MGHLTRISNKLVQLGNKNSEIQAYLQGNDEWTVWDTSVLAKRNAVENVYQWACGRPTTLQDRNRDSDDEDYQDKDYDVAALANNLSQAFRYGIYNNDDIDETQGSLEHDDEDVYFDDESAEVVISSLRLGDDQDSGSLFSNANWFAIEDDKAANERSTGSPASASPNTEGTNMIDEDDSLVDTTTPSSLLEIADMVSDSVKDPKWVEWRETSGSSDPSLKPNGDLPVHFPRHPPALSESGNKKSKP